jgi:hypothetical protein
MTSEEMIRSILDDGLFGDGADAVRQLVMDVDRLYSYLEECQDEQLSILSRGDVSGDAYQRLADLQRKITGCLASRQR